MKRRRKKSRKIRGRKTGRGSGKRTRGAGNRGGRGKAGINKKAAQKKTMLAKYPELSSRKKGFVSVKQKKDFGPKVINIEELEKIASGSNEIDLNKLGYEKLLGKGKIRKKLIVKIASFTNLAKKKIEEAGGKILSE